MRWMISAVPVPGPVLLVEDGAEGGGDEEIVVAVGDGAVPSMLSGQAPAGDFQGLRDGTSTSRERRNDGQSNGRLQNQS